MKDKIKDLLLCDCYNGVIAGIDHWGILLQVTDDEDDVALGYFTLNDRIYAVLCPDYIDIDIKCPLENYDGCAASQEMDYPATISASPNHLSTNSLIVSNKPLIAIPCCSTLFK